MSEPVSSYKTATSDAPSGKGLSWRQKAARSPVTKALLHPAVTLLCLLILFALIFFGTLYQADHGLFEAQKKFFGYGFVLIGGFFPLPSASLVIWVLSVQLAIMMAFHLPWKLNRIGLWVVHAGIMALLVGGFITQVMAVESQLTLAEGETGHFTTAYHEHELAFWESKGDSNHVYAFDESMLRPGRELDLEPYKARIKVQAYYVNSDAFTTRATNGPVYINPSGIGMLEQRKPEKEVTQNAPGLIFTLMEAGKPDKQILLYGQELQTLRLTLDGKAVSAQLRLKHYPLGFSLHLTDFVKNVHPGTDIPSSFESYADLAEGGSSRPVKVWMNNPLRHAGYTFFQASYAQAQGMAEKSTFAVVTNPGRVMPYISSLVVFGGLLLHFLIKLVPFIRREAAK
ncbi:MAG TPA: cytochrome c biogenesis protein ResB [Fibrobacteria bacterium]|nr:cytochrome c biogenesis protein ResB [Fibrobacteria bacterium]